MSKGLRWTQLRTQAEWSQSPTFPWGPPHPMLTLDPKVTSSDIPSPCPDQGLDSDPPGNLSHPQLLLRFSL